MNFDLPQEANVQRYMSGMSTNQWETWERPDGFTNAIILAAGGGGGGHWGNAWFAAGGGSGNGGGGGGWASIYSSLNLLPNRLYIQVGKGGLAGLYDSTRYNTAGSTTYVSLAPSVLPANLLLSCTGGSAGGQAGGGYTVGGSGTIYNTLGISQGWPGGGGGTENDPYVNPGITGYPVGPTYGGAAGGYGYNFTVGTQSAASDLVIGINYPILYDAYNGYYSGTNGYVWQKPLTIFGGTGSYAGYPTSPLPSSGNAAGSATMGAGGGGGGGWLNGGASDGGSGGDGFVYIICY